MGHFVTTQPLRSVENKSLRSKTHFFVRNLACLQRQCLDNFRAIYIHKSMYIDRMRSDLEPLSSVDFEGV